MMLLCDRNTLEIVPAGVQWNLILFRRDKLRACVIEIAQILMEREKQLKVHRIDVVLTFG